MHDLIVSCNSCGRKNRIPEKKQHLQPRCGSCGRPMTIGAAVPVRLGDGDFQHFIGTASLPVLVDFFSPGCGPCRALAPLIAESARRYLGRVIVATLDTSQHPGTAAHYLIKAVPTLIFFQAGREVDRMVGAPSERSLMARLETLGR